MAGPSPDDVKYARLFSSAWRDPAVMDDLMSGDQARIHKRFKDVGLDLEADVNMHVHEGSKTERHMVLPPKAYIDSGSEDPAGKCYGPLCLVLSGPF